MQLWSRNYPFLRLTFFVIHFVIFVSKCESCAVIALTHHTKEQN